MAGAAGERRIKSGPFGRLLLYRAAHPRPTLADASGADCLGPGESAWPRKRRSSRTRGRRRRTRPRRSVSPGVAGARDGNSCYRRPGLARTGLRPCVIARRRVAPGGDRAVSRPDIAVSVVDRVEMCQRTPGPKPAVRDPHRPGDAIVRRGRVVGDNGLIDVEVGEVSAEPLLLRRGHRACHGWLRPGEGSRRTTPGTPQACRPSTPITGKASPG